MKHKAPPLSEMPGMWRRSLLIRADGVRDSSTQVRWLQARSLFVDLRQGSALPDFLQVRCLNDLTRGDCAQLALQEGFAGHFGLAGACFEWRHLIDFQPHSAVADAGQLWWEEETLIETGRDVPYVEHWLRDPTVVTRPLAAVRLRDPQNGDAALAVQVGTVFMFARDRTVALPAGESLAACVAGAGSLAAAQDLVDCEITLGSVGVGANVILASTHPWRVAEYFHLECAESTAGTVDVDRTGKPVPRRWDIVEAEGEPQVVWAAQ
jgi:hypothetical protein